MKKLMEDIIREVKEDEEEETEKWWTDSRIEQILKEEDEDLIKELVDRFGEKLVCDYWEEGWNLRDMEEAYVGEYDDDIAFTEELLKEFGDLKDIPSYIVIDWEATAETLMQDYFNIGRHYFRKM